MGTVGDKLDYLKETKEVIKTAIINKGQDVTDTDTFRSYAEKIDAIKTEGNYQDKVVTPSADEQLITADEGYDALLNVTIEGDSNLTSENIKSGVSIFGVEGTHEGGGTGDGSTLNLQEKNVVPNATGTTVVPDEGYDGLSSVVVTGDGNLVPANIKSGVSIFGVNGIFSGGALGGTDVTVQATDNFSVGDTFVGTAVSGVHEAIYGVASGLSSAGMISEDGTVAIAYQSITATTTTTTVYVKDGEAYSQIQVDLPDMTGATTTVTTEGTINKDGTKIILQYTAFLVLIEVDKTNKTATAEKIEPSSANIADFPFAYGDGYYEVTPTGFTGNLILKGSYLFCCLQGTFKYSTYTFNVYGLLYGRVLAGGISNENILFWQISSHTSATPHVCSGVNDYGENDLLFLEKSGNILYRLEIFNGEIVSKNEISQNASYITSNGKFLVVGSGIYRINQETGSCTQIATMSSSVQMIDETGEYVFYGANCYRVSDTSFTTSLGTCETPLGYNSSDQYFKIVGESYIADGGKRYTLLPSSEAEYTIAHTTSVSTAGDIYGVVTEAMTMGETKTASKIFNA